MRPGQRPHQAGPPVQVVAAARDAGVAIDAVGPYRITRPGPGGLIFGYATVSEHAIAEGIQILASVIARSDR